MLFISNAGNLYGPQKDENSAIAMTRALALGFHVKLDYWSSKVWDSKLHDEPAFGSTHAEFEIPVCDILEYRKRLWINAKTGSALETALLNDLQVFKSHTDSFTLVSTGVLWNAERVHHKAIIVFPETQLEILEDCDVKPFAICTNYPLLARFAFAQSADPVSVFRIGLSLDAQYDISDAKIPESWSAMPEPTTFCASLVCRMAQADVWETMRESLTPFHHQLIVPHFTFQRLTAFRDARWDLGEFAERFERVKSFFKNQDLKILFHRVLIREDCIVLCGYPNFDVMEARKIMNSEYFYSQHYVHATLVRYKHPMDAKTLRSMAAIIELYLPIQVSLHAPKLANCTILGPV